MAEQWTELLFETAERGISSAFAPELLPDTQLAWGGNVTIRGGKPYTRPTWTLRADLPSGLIQGGEYFGIQGGMLVISIGGRLFRVRINNRNFQVDQIQLGFPNSGVLKQVWMCQTVETLVIQDGQSDAIFYNGSVAVRSTGRQVPRGKMMAYGNGRLWVAINDKELVAGDIRTRNPGSELKFTETNYLTGGGSLYFPRGITGLSFIPVTGQADYGALLGFGLDYSKAMRADVTQRDQWASIPGFEQSILNSVGAASQWSIVSVNQDLYWRDSNGGIRSIRNALADEQGPGSSPVSREVSRLTDYDSQQLMPWCSGVYHDNRLLMTSSPFLMPNGGIGWKNLIALDFAPLSSLQGKSQAAYDGQWSGLTIVKLLGGKIRGKDRAFALTTDAQGNNQLWETGAGSIADQTGLCDHSSAVVSSPVRSWIEYPRRNFGMPKRRKRLERCDVWLSDVDGELNLQVYWRADNSQKWLQWDEATTCAKTTDAATTTPHVWKNLTAQERPQFKTFTIPQNINELVGYAAEVGFEFQIRLVWTGFARIHRMMTYGSPLEDPPYAMRDEFQAACIENNVTGNEVVYTIPVVACGVSVSDGTGGGDLCGNSVNFGHTSSAIIDRTFLITNGDNVPVHLGVITVDGQGFSILGQPALEDLNPGQSTSFQVRFNPLGVPQGVATGTVTIPNNGATGNCVISAQVIYNVPLISKVCTSEAGTGELCGFSEFTDPSTPPKKYLAESISGALSGIVYIQDGLCDNPTGATFTVLWSGTIIYDPLSCTVVQDALETIVEHPGGTTEIPLNTVQPTGSECSGDEVVGKDFFTQTGTNACCPSSGTLEQRVTGTRRADLSNEDTEANAMARATKTPGSSCTALIQPRTTGFTFGFVAVAYDLHCSNLIAGRVYRATVELVTANIGGGSPVTTHHNFDFVAVASSQILPEVIDCPSGKQVTVQNETIAIL